MSFIKTEDIEEFFKEVEAEQAKRNKWADEHEGWNAIKVPNDFEAFAEWLKNKI